MTEPEIRVSYGVKELLERMDSRLERIDLKLDAKADSHDLDDLRKRVDGLELRERERNAVARDRGESFSRREKIIGLVLLSIGLAVQLYLARYYIHHK